jgi:PIN domain nuclease of toxin-antitoxin system
VRLLLDTQILVWMVTGDRRMSLETRQAITSPEAELYVSAVTAYEYADLQKRRRIPVSETIDELIKRFDLVLEAFPADCWRIAVDLPRIHRDPVDRMLIAHTLVKGWTLATSDENVRRYPVSIV